MHTALKVWFWKEKLIFSLKVLQNGILLKFKKKSYKRTSLTIEFQISMKIHRCMQKA